MKFVDATGRRADRAHRTFFPASVCPSSFILDAIVAIRSALIDKTVMCCALSFNLMWTAIGVRSRQRPMGARKCACLDRDRWVRVPVSVCV